MNSDIIYSFSKTGNYHKINNIENRDAMFCNANERFEFYAVADGVSSCANSKKGAEIVCSVACEIMMNEFDYYIDSSKEKAAWLITKYLRQKLENHAAESDRELKTFASTLCFFCIEKRTGRAISFTLGDSHLYIIGPNGINLSKGTKLYEDNIICATVTENADLEVTINYYDRDEYESFILCTDGVWKTLTTSDGFYENQTTETYIQWLEDIKEKNIQDDATVLFVVNNSEVL